MELDFDKMNGLVPAIIQDNETRKVLMLGFMNKEAYDKTVETGKVTFFSRTKNRLWTKGEESGNFLHVVSIKADCDNDTLLIQADPAGPVCRQTSRRNARRILYHQLVRIRNQQDCTEGGRRSCGNSDRSDQWNKRTFDL